jgi:hypothetical protein
MNKRSVSSRESPNRPCLMFTTWDALTPDWRCRATRPGARPRPRRSRTCASTPTRPWRRCDEPSRSGTATLPACVRTPTLTRSGHASTSGCSCSTRPSPTIRSRRQRIRPTPGLAHDPLHGGLASNLRLAATARRSTNAMYFFASPNGLGLRTPSAPGKLLALQCLSFPPHRCIRIESLLSPPQMIENCAHDRYDLDSETPRTPNGGLHDHSNSWAAVRLQVSADCRADFATGVCGYSHVGLTTEKRNARRR